MLAQWAHSIPRKNLLYSIPVVLYLVCCGYAIEVLAELYADREITEQKARVRSQLLATVSDLEAALYRDTYLADSLATVITINPDTAMQNWTGIADKLLNKSSFARNVGIAPNNVISHVYPLEGNEKALGFDFRTRPEQYKTVQAARERQDVFIAGPVDLVQGGKGLIARFPIFEDYPANTRYWGGVSVVMDFDKLISHTNLNTIAGTDIGIRGKDGMGASGDLILGNPEWFNQPDEVFEIKLPNGSWQLAVNYDLTEIPSIANARNLIRYTGAIIALILLVSLTMLLNALKVARDTALKDELTGLPNRRYLMNRLRELLSPNRRVSYFTLVNLDLNGFKAVNDTYGHDAGDKLLVAVSQTLERCLRSSDCVARIGGDEFIIVLNRVSEPEPLTSILEKIRTEISNTTLVWYGKTLIPAISLGYAVFNGQDTSIKELMAEADQNMYTNKRQSKVVPLKHG